MKLARILTSAHLSAVLLLGTIMIAADAGADGQDDRSGTQTAATDDRLNALIRHRQATMKRIGEHMRAVIAFAKGGPGSFDQIVVYASEIKAIADQMPQMFPQGSGMGDPLDIKTGAKPEIWADWDRFMEHAEMLSAEASKLKDVAASRDKSSLKRQFMILGRDGCSGCHEMYREKI